MAKEHILIVEDEVKIVSFLRRGLSYEGYEVSVAYTGQEALFKARQESPDLIILDLMLPDMDGLEVCRTIRSKSDVPILILTAKDAVSDRVAGLDSGADDYLVKPFALDELLARVRALLRRHKRLMGQKVLKFADIKMNISTREVWRGDRYIELTPKEFDLLELFMRHPNQVLTRDLIYEEIWGYDFSSESNLIEVYIRYLRAKLEAKGESRVIHTVRGIGYTLRE
ncbi:MAG: DNA-binding response regulator [Chloroflexi bacterium]|nr:MAG: DNA-binding response regulator [Chloroflexota bacterium]HDN80545.1 response regulator transcription factor [Chloroflexota bacterium]